MTNKEPRLRFTEEERSDPALEKPIHKAEKAAARADKAQGKIPKQKVPKIVMNKDTGKVTAKLVLEDKKKPPSKLTHTLMDAPANTLTRQLHRKIQETEQDNVGVESAHKSEGAVEAGARLMREGYRSSKLRPYRKAAQAERNLEKANVEALYRKSLREEPQFSSNPMSRWRQKQAIKKRYAAAKSGKVAAGNAANAAGTTAKATGEAARKTKQGAAFLTRHKRGAAILLAGFLLVGFLLNAVSSCSVIAQTIVSGIASGSYPASEEAILDAEAAYTAKERELQSYLDTITDGKIEKIPQPVVDTPTAEPVVYISKTVLEPTTAQAGDSFTMTVTLKNSITTKYVRNMLVTVDTGNVQIDLEEDSNIFPIEKIDKGGEVELTLHFSTEPAIPSGKYPINFSFKYDSSKTLNLSSNGSTVVEIQQPANMELVMPRFADSVSVGETVPVTFQVMNMGRSSMYNVRCVVSGFGLVPSNTGYIGTMEAGTSKNTKVELYIITLNASAGNENGPQYGNTTGTVTLIYEDETGQEYSQEATFDTTVNRPVVQLPQNNTEEEKKEQRAGSWWVSVTILGGVILAAVGTILFIQKKKHRGGNYL